MRPPPGTRLLALLPLLLAAGCHRGPAIAPGAPPEPIETGGPPALAYRFELLSTNPLRVAVGLDFRGSPTGTTTLRCAERWGGVERPDRDLGTPAVTGADGSARTVTHPAAHLWQVEHVPEEALRLRYEPVTGCARRDTDLGCLHRPIVEPGLFQLMGPVGLLVPEHLMTDETHLVEIVWQGLGALPGWTAACSHGLGPGPLRRRLTVEDMRHAVFLAGPLQVLSREVAGNQLALAVAPADWGFALADLADLAARIVLLERAFFSDSGDPFFLMTLVPATSAVPGRTALAGTGLTDSFALTLSPGIGLLPGSRGRAALLRLLAHEQFHRWNGRRIRRADPDEWAYWFSEGFTVFYTDRLLLRAGLLTAAEVVDDWNETLVALWTSPAREAPNRRVAEGFWAEATLQDLPYRRGRLVAALADRALRGAGQTDGLDGWMRSLELACRTGDHRWTSDELLTRLLVDLPAAPAAALRSLVVDGRLDDPPADLFAPCARLESRPIGTFELGFDAQRSMAERRVHGVRGGSAAWRAGLRDGQRLAGWSFEMERADRPAELVIEEGHNRRVITYLPGRDPRPVPQLVLVDPKACPQRL